MKKTLLAVVISLFLCGSASAAEFNNNLKFGSKGNDVKKLQEFLTEQNLYNGPITGNFFSLTLKSIKAFQVREAINPASGFFGLLTRARVNSLLNEQLVDSESESVSDPVVSEPAPVSAEVLRLNEILGAVQSQNTLLQDQNDLLANTLASQQTALNQIVENTHAVIPPPVEPAPVIDPLTVFPCNILANLVTKCAQGMWNDGTRTYMAVKNLPDINGDTRLYLLMYWKNGWLIKESFNSFDKAVAEFNQMVEMAH